MIKNVEKQVFEHYQKIRKSDYLLSLLYWDLETSTPEKQVEMTIKIIEDLNDSNFELYSNSEFVKNCELILECSTNLKFKKLAEKIIDINEILKLYDKDEYIKLETEKVKSNEAWKQAHNKNDFSIFLPFLKNGIKQKFDYINRLSKIKKFDEKYDYLLNNFEKGLTTKECDDFFDLIKRKVVPVYLKLKENTNDDTDLVKLSNELQDKLANYTANLVEFNKSKGQMARSMHPFSSSLNPGCDVRMTYRYEENSGLDTFLTIMHESGHSLQGQGGNEELIEFGLSNHSSLIVNEAISRTYENYFGKNKSLISTISEELNGILNLKHTSDFYYNYLNKLSSSSKIRVEADELSYPIHVLIRYEIEKSIFNGSLDIDNIEKQWNKLYKDYLNETIENSNEGILQDVHWSDWSFGYFPTYAMGSAYGISLFNKINKLENIEKLLVNKDFNKINNIYNNLVFSHGDLLNRKELINEVTGKDFNPNEYVDYLLEKFEK